MAEGAGLAGLLQVSCKSDAVLWKADLKCAATPYI